MTCKKIQKMVLDGWQRIAGDSPGDHVENCTDCQMFIEEINFLRSHLKPLPEVSVPPELDREVLELGHQELSRTLQEMKQTALPDAGIPVPRLVAFGLVFIIAITLWIILPSFGNLNLGETLTPRDRFILLLIGQNALMLILSPVIFKKFGKKQHIFQNITLQNGSGDMTQQEV